MIRIKSQLVSFKKHILIKFTRLNNVALRKSYSELCGLFSQLEVKGNAKSKFITY